MSTNTQEAVISNEALVLELESKLESITPEARTILEEVISRIKNIGKYISEFLKRGKNLTVEPAPELVINEASIRQSLEKVIQRERSRGNEEGVWVDDCIWGDVFKGETMLAIEKQLNVTIYRLKQTVTHAKVREESDKLSVKKDWNIAEAWNIMIAGILAGEVRTKGTSIFVYFTMKVDGEDVLYRFRAFRSDADGQLDVYVSKVNQQDKFCVGDGIILSN